MANETLPEPPLITDEEFDSMAASCRAYVDSRMIDHPVSVFPQMLLQVHRRGEAKPELHVVVFDVPFNETRDKQYAIAGQGVRIRQEGLFPLAWFLITECWRSSDMYDGERRKYRLPEDDPNRIESLMYAGMAIDGRLRHGARDISRDRDERMSFTDEWKITPATTKLKFPLLAMFAMGWSLGATSAQSGSK